MLVNLSRSDLLRLAQVVRDETGNHVQEKNFPMLESRIRGHVLKLGLSSIEDYWVYFNANEKQERELLQSLMTTHYTFFFREYAHFEILGKWIEEESERLKVRFEKTKQSLRIWSAACSRGQEVYSLAMFLDVALTQKHGVPFEIVGTDIDSESIAHARNGVYAIQEVNTIPQIYLNGYWKRGTGPIKDFAAVHPTLKSKAQFETLNLFEISTWKNQSKFDVIFCRNVFIYFSEENVKKVALDLSRRLESRGLLFSGVSEPIRFTSWPLKLIGPSAYQNFVGNENPQAIKETSPAPSALSLASESKFLDNAKYRVLCVDDSTTIQTLIKKIFSTDPNCERVDVAGNGREARAKLDSGRYDLITLDIHMPEVNGIEFLEGLYKKKADPPVLMISSVNRTDIELATKSIALGAFDYVEKPAMNNLQKSTDEILTKARMALRIKTKNETEAVGSFDTSISQQIVVPDASQCLRVLLTSSASKKLFEQVVRGQKNEYRSPALLILWKDSSESANIESELLSWTNRQIVSIKDSNQALKPNCIYLAKDSLHSEVLSTIKAKSISLQILDQNPIDLSPLRKASSLQVLIDESLGGQRALLEKINGFLVSDITPATSFPSLSVEFFAHLRKAA
jgi:chemotaxis protein methyltransferase CheR